MSAASNRVSLQFDHLRGAASIILKWLDRVQWTAHNDAMEEVSFARAPINDQTFALEPGEETAAACDPLLAAFRKFGQALIRERQAS